MDYLIGLVVALLGGFLYQRNRANVASARNENLEVKEQLNDINKDIAHNDGALESEEQKQSELRKELEDAKLSEGDVESIANFLNKRK